MKRLSALLLGLLASCGTPEFVGAHSDPQKLGNSAKPPSGFNAGAEAIAPAAAVLRAPDPGLAR